MSPEVIPHGAQRRFLARRVSVLRRAAVYRREIRNDVARIARSLSPLGPGNVKSARISIVERQEEEKEEDEEKRGIEKKIKKEMTNVGWSVFLFSPVAESFNRPRITRDARF